ncbi:MAG TPA: FMN-binding protein [Coriobacteriia bacterium]|nr:FMN-binding protein [Coriobacteriia bacterium]
MSTTKTKTILVTCGAAVLSIGLSGCGAAFEGSGSKDAASAEQLAMTLEDPWGKTVTVSPDKIAEGSLQDGVYKGTGRGMAGLISVTLYIEGNRITCLAVEQTGETQSVGGYEAIRDGVYASMIEAAQGSEIDAISGATITTAGVRQAVEQALENAEKGLQAPQTNIADETDGVISAEGAPDSGTTTQSSGISEVR